MHRTGQREIIFPRDLEHPSGVEIEEEREDKETLSRRSGDWLYPVGHVAANFTLMITQFKDKKWGVLKFLDEHELLMRLTRAVAIQ
jgi:hypothetical protein